MASTWKKSCCSWIKSRCLLCWLVVVVGTTVDVTNPSRTWTTWISLSASTCCPARRWSHQYVTLVNNCHFLQEIIRIKMNVMSPDFHFLFQHFKHPLASNCSAASQYGQCALLSWTSNNFSSAIPKLDRRIQAAAEVHSSKVSKWFFHALFCVFCFVFSCKIVSPSHPLHSWHSTARWGYIDKTKKLHWVRFEWCKSFNWVFHQYLD